MQVKEVNEHKINMDRHNLRARLKCLSVVAVGMLYLTWRKHVKVMHVFKQLDTVDNMTTVNTTTGAVTYRTNMKPGSLPLLGSMEAGTRL